MADLESNRSLCQRCLHVREIVTPRGSHFLLCRLSQNDSRYPRYPPQPVLQCTGFQQQPVETGSKEPPADP